MATSDKLFSVDEEPEIKTEEVPPKARRMPSIPSFGSMASFAKKKHYENKYFLFYCPSMKKIAKQIADQSKGSIILGDIQWKKFKDGVCFINI